MTDAKAWAEFPYAEHDVVILDSISAATEGVEERDGGKTGAAIAPLLDATAKGLAVVVLANTQKTGEAVRGSGVIGDRASLIWEIRDATDLQLDPKLQTWWECLPEASDKAWGARAKRRSQRETLRLGFVVSKCRLDVEPRPFVLEVRMPTETPWEIVDVTEEVEAEHARAKGEAIDATEQRKHRAVEALRAHLPMRQNPDAISLLTDHGLSRDEARKLISDRAGQEWILSGKGHKGNPAMLLSAETAAGNHESEKRTQTGPSEGPIPAGTGAQGPQESIFKNGAARGTSDWSNSCGWSEAKAGIRVSGDEEGIELYPDDEASHEDPKSKP